MANSNPSFILQEMEIALGIPQQDPTFFNIDFLSYTGIVPDEWEPIGAPRRSPQLAQVNFQNDVSLTAEPRQTIFSELLGEKGMEDIEIPHVALRFVDIMKNVNYTHLNLNFRGYVAFPNAPRAAHDYFFKNLFNPGAWQDIGTAPIRAGLDLVYTFGEQKLDFSVQEAAIRRLDETSVAALLFSGSFGMDYNKLAPQARIESVQKGIKNWNNDLKQFIEVVSRFFRNAKQEPPQESQPTTIPL